MEQQQQQTEETGTEIALIEQDKSTVKILQEDDLKNLKDAVEKIKGFKRKYSLKKLTVTDIDSKEQKEKLRLAIADVRTSKTTLEKDKKEKTLPYRSTVAFINTNYDKVIEAAESILDPLKAHKKEVDDLIEAKDKEAEIQAQQRLNDRVSKVITAGSIFDGEFYSIGSDEFGVSPVSLGIVDLQTMTDGIFENVLAQIIEKAAIISEAQAKKDEEARIAEEQRIAKEAAEKKLFEEQQAKLKKEQDDLAAEMAEFKRQKEELLLAQEKLAQDKLDEENRLKQAELAKKEATKKERIQQLTAPGLHWDGAYYSLGYKHLKVQVSLTQIEELSTEDWDSKMSEVYAGITEQALLVKEDKDAADKKAAEDKIISDKAIADKALADQKEADDLAEKNRIEALNKQGDSALWSDFISRLKAISYPEVKSNDFQIKVNDVRKFIDGLK